MKQPMMTRPGFATLAALLLLSSSAPAVATAYKVPDGCPVPQATASHKWFVNLSAPAGGNGMSGATAFNTLQAALAVAGPNDHIELAPGAYGDVALPNQNNADFITIEDSGEGTRPVIHSLGLAGGSKWVLNGLNFQANASELGANNWFLVNLADAHSSIIVNGSTFGAPMNGLTEAQLLKQWTSADWQANAPQGINDYPGTFLTGDCMAFTNNEFRNTATTIVTQNSDRVLIDGLNAKYLYDDGIDEGSNRVVVRNVWMRDWLYTGNVQTYHTDMLQVQPWGDTQKLKYLTIARFLGIRQTDPNDPPTPSNISIQGISIFNGGPQTVNIESSAVVTSATQGIAIYQVPTATVENVTLLNDGNGMQPTISGEQTGTLIIRNVLASAITAQVGPNGVQTLIEDHDYLLQPPNGTPQAAYIQPTGGMQWANAPGTYGGITILPLTYAQVFKGSGELVNGSYDWNLNLLPGTPLIGAGNPASAPKFNLAGKPMTSPPNIGAY